VLKRKTNLTRQQWFRLRDLLRYNLQTARAYLMQEDFQQVWEYEAHIPIAIGIGCGARWSVASAPGAPSMGPK
jgi:Transposase